MEKIEENLNEKERIGFKISEIEGQIEEAKEKIEKAGAEKDMEKTLDILCEKFNCHIFKSGLYFWHDFIRLDLDAFTIDRVDSRNLRYKIESSNLF